jgi:pimeloyl-ACP methyl ester carboxylesterase
MSTCKRLVPSLLLLALVSGCALNQVHAQGGGLFRIGAPTMGGMWVWADEVIYHDYRIQKHALVGHYRLIDPNNNRLARGDFQTCLAKLDEIKVADQLPPLPNHVVIVLHGLGANRQFMNGISNFLREDGGYFVINFGYPSTMLKIEDYAQSLDSVIRHLDGVQTVSFVAHSMGNIVVRKYLRDVETLTPAMRPQVTYERMVMIAPPNHGAEIADTLHNGDVTRELAELFAGEPAKQLAPGMGWPALEAELATPSFEFGIIAGGRGDDAGYLDMIPGDDDSLLSIETMKLAGATDWIQTKGIHQLMPNFNEVRAATLSYLQHGYFVAADARRPIVAAVEPAPAATP